jgi:RNA polymerase sigma-70 factor (ECF subfamily)
MIRGGAEERCRLLDRRASSVHGAEEDRANLGLVGQAGVGNERAFLALVDRHHTTLTRVARLWLDDPQAIEALVQETWVRMLQRLERFDQQSSLKGWLCVTLIRLARARVDPALDEPVEPSATEAALPAVDPERFSPRGDRWEGHWQKPPTDWPIMDSRNSLPNVLQRVLEAAIQALPRSQRIIVVLRDVERLSSHEVQSALGSSDDDQRVLLHHGRSRLRAVLEHHHLTHAAHMPAGEVENAL